ncbi:hypothetical protein JWG40_02885 [Leptospira sp. 201903074]|uniref:GH36-type glycosyl hydrolase domain-containing protein n=1 Tax=Leptospira abararensis TaxID=2810036 RepID=UPI0019663B57|nr:hypothetical protein [Leptospira abararensis]MBM9545947.1 hypothetical protein [Leptospira abararensis]
MIQTIQNQSGLKFHFLSNGNLHSIRFHDLLVNLYLGNEMEPSVSNIYLRIHTKNELLVFPLLGPKSNSLFQISESSYLSEGSCHKIDFTLYLELHPNEPIWKYQVVLTNQNDHSLLCDLVYVQDIGICEYSASRLNEYFVCHYIHHEPIFSKDFGYGILSRQNELVSGKHPASFLFSSERISSYVTDGLDLYPNGLNNPLLGKRRQGEHSIIGLEREAFTLKPRESQSSSFYGSLFSNLETLKSFNETGSFIEKTITNRKKIPNIELPFSPSIPSFFTSAKPKYGDKATELDLKSFFPNPWREVEKDDTGSILSFFTNESTHVVLKEKESLCLRPHGQILRTGLTLRPDESSLTTTCYYKGIFLSQLTEGHTSINQYLSRNHSYIGLFHSYGFRIFREEDSELALLDSPSFVIMEPHRMEWIYLWNKEKLQIQVKTTKDHKINFQLKTTEKNSRNYLLSFPIALDGDNGSLEEPPIIVTNKTKIQIQPNPESSLYQRLDGKGFQIESESLNTWEISDDRFLFPDGKSRNQSYLTARVSVNSYLRFTIQGNLETSFQNYQEIEKQNVSFSFSSPNDKIQNAKFHCLQQIQEILPWFEQNARIHYLNPRGLEQYSGGGWGTRDVCQGAFEFLLAMGEAESCRSLLYKVFQEQNEDGDWPQWFMLYPRDQKIRASDSHGDIIYWPILALSSYLERTNDLDFLKETTTGPHRPKPRTILQAIDKTISLMNDRLVPTTKLPIYGNGDWNDSLQPVRAEFRTHAVSTWTAELQSITYKALITIFHLTNQSERQKNFETELATLEQNIKEHCMADGILSGLRYFSDDDSQKFYLHPSDKKTGIHYSVLPMIYGILSEVLDEKEVETHLSLIKSFLMGPDGVRLFDSPIPYSDGESKEFKRAETASYFGREIGLIYTHAHLRYCEALSHLGRSEEFFYHLNLVNPIGIQKKIPQATRRQSNCYYSSSDALFLDRYQASKEYKEILSGNVPLEGGWRVYSSGPGIYIRLVYECLFGIKVYYDGIEFDPTLPKGLDGLQKNIQLREKNLTILYEVESDNATVESVILNQKSIPFVRKNNHYRRGGVRIQFSDLELFLKEDNNQLTLLLR